MSLPKPYFEDDSVVIYHADCRDVLPRLSGVGLFFTSPPYNLNAGGWTTRGSKWSRISDGYADHDDAMPEDEYRAWQQDSLRLMWAALADNGAVYYQHKPVVRGNETLLPTRLIPDGIPLRQIVYWNRLGTTQRSFWHYSPMIEWVMVLAKEAFRLNTMDGSDVWAIHHESGSAHPAAFPVGLPRKAIATTDAGLIVDPFMGSGTTLRAAKDLGRTAIGIEISERYCEIAVRRMAQGVLL